jgi:hypothetical protein
MTNRRFPPPWTVERLPGGFKVIDANGQSLAYFYARENDHDANTAGVLTMDEARRMASNFAKLPDLLGKVRPDDDIQAVGNLSDERHEAEDTTPEEPVNIKARTTPAARIRLSMARSLPKTVHGCEVEGKHLRMSAARTSRPM